MKHEIKSTLAKLLATEDLVVEHKNVETAQFDVHSRVLTLPNWDKASEGVFDMLVCHEVGHALYTPDVDWREGGRVTVFKNGQVVEDNYLKDLDYKLIDDTIEEIKKSCRKVCTSDYAANNVYIILQLALKKVTLAEA